MTDIDYASRVARGIALMDEKWPDWATEIDLERLDIEDASYCVTAQYAGQKFGYADFSEGRRRLDLSTESYVGHGFNVEPGDFGAYAILNRLWRDEILRRRAQADTAPAEPEASS